MKEQEFTKDLLYWYNKNKRDLPWRKQATSYYVWISEIMLQQTRVEAVKPYFLRFIQELPTLFDLANASDDVLHKLWQGLGYYNRVKNMKKCAQICVEKYQGNLPSTYQELLELPGIGPYTAGAIASIAFDKKVVAIDGNVLRVFSRILCLEDDILKNSTKKKFQAIIETYLPDEDCGDFNQALMELGAMICIPNGAPLCNICPVQKYCKGYKEGKAHLLPIKTIKKGRRQEDKTIVLIVSNHQVVLHKRKEGLLQGLYEYTTFSKKMSEAELKRELMIDYHIEKIQPLPEAKHVFSHVEWHMQGYLVEVEAFQKEDLTSTKQQLETIYAIPTAFKEYTKVCLSYLK